MRGKIPTEIIDLTADTDESGVDENLVSVTDHHVAYIFTNHDPVIPMALHRSMTHFSFKCLPWYKYIYLSRVLLFSWKEASAREYIYYIRLQVTSTFLICTFLIPEP